MSHRATPLTAVHIETDTDGGDGDDQETSFDWRPFISIDPEIVFGKPRVAGTRLAVEFLLELFAAGWSEATVLDNFPDLTQADLRAVFAYAASLAKERQERPTWMSTPVDDPDAAASFTTVRNDDIRQRLLPT